MAGARAPGPLLPWLPSIPLFFLGLGVYRAWIEIVFVGSFVEFPAAAVAGHDAFDLVMIATMFLCAALAKRIGPLFGKRSLYAVSGVALTVSTLCMFASIWIPRSADALAVPAVLLGGFGIALVGTVRLSQSVARGAVLFGVHDRGGAPHLFVQRLAVTVARRRRARAARRVACRLRGGVPLVAFRRASARQAVEVFVPLEDRAAHGHLRVRVRAEGIVDVPVDVRPAFGVRHAGVIARGGKFDFGVIYRIALPLMVAAFLILPNVGVLGQAASDFCTSASYTAFSILIMLIMANLCYRYGMSAVWLFGIERGVRALFTLFGRQTEQLLGAPSFGLAGSDAVVSGLVVILVVAATMILFSEKELSSRWGVSFLGEDGTAGDRAIVKKQELANRCQELARSYGLSPREEEVLLLLAQRKTVGSIERELFIANGTAKTHIRHIYRKLDIHSRDELSDLLGLFE